MYLVVCTHASGCIHSFSDIFARMDLFRSPLTRLQLKCPCHKMIIYINRIVLKRRL